MAAKGINSIVALSSIHLSLGHSAATHNGAKIGISHNGVLNWYQQIDHKIAKNTVPR